MKIKICGMLEAGNIKSISLLKPDYMGFIFYNGSERCVNKGLIITEIPEGIVKTGVFVNEDADIILQTAQKYRLNAIQLHGTERPELCGVLKQQNYQVIKTFAVTDDCCFAALDKYTKACSYFLFDSPTVNYGGSGRKFNWEELNNYTGDAPFFLSGGLGPHNIDEALALNHPKLYGFDLNSRLEKKPGIKDEILTAEIINKIRTHEIIKA